MFKKAWSLINYKIVLGCFFTLFLIMLFLQSKYNISFKPIVVSDTSRWYGIEELNINITDIKKNNSSEFSCENFPSKVESKRKILWLSEAWESGSENGPLDQIGYTSLVKNNKGNNKDSKFYLLYAIHDAGSSIGLAISDHINHNFKKILNFDNLRWDSIVLRSPLRPYYSCHFVIPPKNNRSFK